MRLGLNVSVLLLLGACDEPGGSAADNTRPPCFVDFPCSREVASCGLDPTSIVPFEDRSHPPCIGLSCGHGAKQECREGTLCVEPVLQEAECRPVAETCGGSEHRVCADGLVCVHRHSYGDQIACVVGPWDLVGVCEPPAPEVGPCTFPLVCDLPSDCAKLEACDEYPSQIWHYAIDECTVLCAPPCIGQVCGPSYGEACPNGTVCVETVAGATCRDPSQACGGSERIACAVGERCIHRASVALEQRECEVRNTEHFGSCERTTEVHPRCE